MRAAHPAAVPFLLGADHARATGAPGGGGGGAGVGSAAVSARRLRVSRVAALLPTSAAASRSGSAAARRSAGFAPTGAAAFSHLYHASVLLLLSAALASVRRLDPSLALAAMGAHCACFPARRHLSALCALLLLSLAADALWLHTGADSALAAVGGLLALPPMCGLGDPYGAWRALPLAERGGLHAPPRLLPWAAALPAPELAAAAFVVLNAPLKLVAGLLATHALWRVRREAEEDGLDGRGTRF